MVRMLIIIIRSNSIDETSSFSGIRQSTELENAFTSVERVIEYQTIDPEPSLDSEPDKKPPNTWPDKGNIVFEKLSMRYEPNPDSDHVLKDLNLQIHRNGR